MSSTNPRLTPRAAAYSFVSIVSARRSSRTTCGCPLSSPCHRPLLRRSWCWFCSRLRAGGLGSSYCLARSEMMSGERPALVGRERHLRELTMLLDGIVAGRGNLVVLSGEAGAGKTRLAEEAAAFATAAGVAVAWATCWSNGAVPLSTWLDLQSMVDERGTMSPLPEAVSGEADPEVARAMLVRTLVARLRMAIGARPTLVVVDDLQWCDPLSLHAIEVLVG